MVSAISFFFWFPIEINGSLKTFADQPLQCQCAGEKSQPSQPFLLHIDSAQPLEIIVIEEEMRLISKCYVHIYATSKQIKLENPALLRF